MHKCQAWLPMNPHPQTLYILQQLYPREATGKGTPGYALSGTPVHSTCSWNRHCMQCDKMQDMGVSGRVTTHSVCLFLLSKPYVCQPQ